MIRFHALSNRFANSCRPGRPLLSSSTKKGARSTFASIFEIAEMRTQRSAMPVAATVTTAGMSASMATAGVSATTVTAATMSAAVTTTVVHATVSAAAVHAAMTATTAMPTTPALTAAPAKAAPVGVSAPIESWAVPTIGIEAIIPAAENELGLFDRAEIGSGRAQLRQRHRLRRAHHHQRTSSRSAQSERQPKLPHYVLMI
jgi:hypothetical protein